MVVTRALFWTDLVTVFGLSVTDFGPGFYDHFNYDHLDVVRPVHLLRVSISEGLTQADS